jgi:nitrite reductase/ring-hydroxylating ferredoxin subunit
MSEAWVDLGPGAALTERGAGLRFTVARHGESRPAFAVRFEGRVHAYLNRCAHVAMELDWQPGQFFDVERGWLVCSTHGALYDPADGGCAGGPCAGRGGLLKLEVEERDGRLWWRPGPGWGPTA